MTFAQKIGFLFLCLPIVMGLFLTPNFSFADHTPSHTGTSGSGSNNPTSGSGQNNGQVDPVTLENPLRVDSLEALLVAILNIFITLMIPVIVFFIILAGFKYVTAQGSPGRIEEATTTFTYAVIGGVLILAAVAIAEIIKNTVAAF